VLQGTSTKVYTRRLVFKSDGRILFVPLNEILCIRAEGNYAHVHTIAGPLTFRSTVSRLQWKLQAEAFLRIHRSSIVNLRFVKAVVKSPSWIVELSDGSQLPIGRAYWDQVSALMRDWQEQVLFDVAGWLQANPE
jgi:two-component system LytT family response regulator